MHETHQVQGVGCHVSDCVHNAEGTLCQAPHILIGNEERKCDEKTDTFCNTFTAK